MASARWINQTFLCIDSELLVLCMLLRKPAGAVSCSRHLSSTKEIEPGLKHERLAGLTLSMPGFDAGSSDHPSRTIPSHVAREKAAPWRSCSCE